MTWVYGKYDGVHFALSVLYFLLACYSLVALTGMFMQIWTLQRWQKFFHPVMILGCLVRAFYFFLQPFIRESFDSFHWLDNRLNLVLLTLPSFVFFCDYLIILFLWAELYHYHPDEVKIVKLRPIVYAAISSMFGVYGFLFIMDFILGHKVFTTTSSSTNPIEKTILVYVAALYVVTSFGFLFYGVKIYSSFSYFAPTPKRRRLLRRVAGLTSLITLCFVIRAVLIIYLVFDNLSQDWYFDGVYFVSLEWIPLILMMIVLRGPTRKREEVLVVSSASSSGLPSPALYRQPQDVPYLIYYPDEAYEQQRNAVPRRDKHTTKSEKDALMVNT